MFELNPKKFLIKQFVLIILISSIILYSFSTKASEKFRETNKFDLKIELVNSSTCLDEEKYYIGEIKLGMNFTLIFKIINYRITKVNATLIATYLMCGCPIIPTNNYEIPISIKGFNSIYIPIEFSIPADPACENKTATAIIYITNSNYKPISNTIYIEATGIN